MAKQGKGRHSRVLLYLAIFSLGPVQGCLFVTMQCMCPCATWQKPLCDLLWTNDSAKCLLCLSLWIKLDCCCQTIQLCVALLYFY